MPQRQSLFKSFASAFRGICHSIGERNFFIQILMGATAVVLAIALRLSEADIAIILILVAFVLATEVMNSACERMLNFITKERNPEVARIKEMLAASVLIYSLTAVVIGVMIFSHAFR